MEQLSRIIGKAPSELTLGDYIVSLAVERQRAQKILESLRTTPTRAMIRGTLISGKGTASGKTTTGKKIRESVLDEMAQNAGVSRSELEELIQQMKREKAKND